MTNAQTAADTIDAIFEEPKVPVDPLAFPPSPTPDPGPAIASHEAQQRPSRVRSKMTAADERKRTARDKAREIRARDKERGYVLVTRRMPVLAVPAVDFLLHDLCEKHEEALRKRLSPAKPLSPLEKALRNVGQQIAFVPATDFTTERLVMRFDAATGEVDKKIEPTPENDEADTDDFLVSPDGALDDYDPDELLSLEAARDATE